MIKAVLWDIDGVLIRQDTYFDAKLEEENYTNPTEILRGFRTTDINLKCDQGVLDPLEEIIPFLGRIGWTRSNKEYFNAQYEFESNYIDYSLIEEIQNLREKGYKCFIASNQNYYRKDFLLSRLNIQDNFDGFFFSYDAKALKTESRYWDILIKDIQQQENIRPEDMLFLDDMRINLDKASHFGIHTWEIKSSADINYCVEKLLTQKEMSPAGWFD